MSAPRAIKRDQFLQTHSFEPTQLAFLASDMSLRQYYRLNAPKRVLMDAPAPENPKQFIQVAKYLQHCGLRAPSILEHCLENGFVLLEDFGDHTFTTILKQSPAREKELYQTSMTVLKHLHEHAVERPSFIPLYSTEKLLMETEVFIDWYWKAITGEEPKPSLKEDFQNRWKKAFESCPSTSQSLVLRDFHVDNLMIVDEQDGIKGCGLLDFQDALWGSVVYDAVSLLEDARRDITSSVAKEMWQYFLDTFPPSEHQNYKTAAAILGAGRHTKIIGVFTRYAMRQGKRDYLCHLPRLWRYLEKSLAISELQDVKDWFDCHLPVHQQNIPTL